MPGEKNMSMLTLVGAATLSKNPLETVSISPEVNSIIAHTTASPARAPMPVSNRFSHITCHNSTPRLAPNDLRTPSSDERMSMRLEIRLLRFRAGTSSSISSISNSPRRAFPTVKSW